MVGNIFTSPRLYLSIGECSFVQQNHFHVRELRNFEGQRIYTGVPLTQDCSLHPLLSNHSRHEITICHTLLSSQSRDEPLDPLHVPQRRWTSVGGKSLTSCKTVVSRKAERKEFLCRFVGDEMKFLEPLKCSTHQLVELSP